MIKYFGVPKMNRHERRAAAARGAKLARKQKQRIAPNRAGQIWVGEKSAIPAEIKRDIAGCVRAVQWDLSGQDCLGRAKLGMHALRHLGFDPSLEIGSLLYRGGLDPVRDMIAFHTDGNVGALVDGCLFGHFWLSLNGEIVDFTSGDWASSRYEDDDTGLGAIEWISTPPEAIWMDKSSFDWHANGTPELGEAWYGPWRGEYPEMSECGNTVIRMSDQVLRDNLARLNLHERVQPYLI